MAGKDGFTIATRRSPLAQTQTGHVQKLLAAAAGRSAEEADEAFPLETFLTTGDTNLSGSLAEIGGKGLFTKEIEQALIYGVARFAVHSMKDMPAEMPPGLVLAAIPPREDPRDCFISEHAASPWDLPDGALVGAASVRRIAQIKSRRPDIRTTVLRGNVGTRLDKVRQGEIDGTFLAAAGLRRLGLLQEAARTVSVDEMLPAVGQGALCVQAREDDAEELALARKITCPDTEVCVAVERAFLAELDGSCRTPIAGLAVIDAGDIYFRGEVLSLDGRKRFSVERRMSRAGADIAAAAEVGKTAGEEIRTAAGAAFFAALAAQS